MLKKKRLSILGSTGSIGCNALKIVEMFPDSFSISSLAAARNTSLLASQIKRFQPEIAVVLDEKIAVELKKKLAGIKVKIMYGNDGYCTAAAHKSVDMLVSAISGAAGLMPTLAAINAEKDVALANKETLVIAGELVMQKVAQKGVALLPIDSEHSAIFQCLEGFCRQDVEKIFLTASGGPFLNTPKSEFADIKPQHALKHPTWQMGKKISVDSATLMNKGLEVIEAKWLFDVPADNIEVIIHPQSIIHSMVAYKDGSVIAQLGVPDMKGAIAYAMSYPKRLELKQPFPDFANIGTFDFKKPDLEKFPCLSLAYKACKNGGTLPAVLNASNEIAVEAFLENRIAFTKIPEIISNALKNHSVVTNPSLSDIVKADKWARNFCSKNN